jgi:tol-pal system protein YbgF
LDRAIVRNCLAITKRVCCAGSFYYQTVSDETPKMVLRKLLLIALAVLAVSPVRAGLFDDPEARKRILANEAEMRQRNAALDERIAKLENSIKNLGLLELVNQIEELKAELARLRGQIEVLNNQISTVDKKQRDFYLDIDSRLRRLEQPSGVTKPGATAPTQPIDPKEAMRQEAAEKKAYDLAYTSFQKKDYAKAISAFQSFINDYPASQQIPSAQYWIGLSHQNLRDLKSSLVVQQNLIKKYPDSPKVPDAMLAIAAIQAEQGESVVSRKQLEDIIAQYPNSDAAGKARQRLAGR